MANVRGLGDLRGGSGAGGGGPGGPPGGGGGPGGAMGQPQMLGPGDMFSQWQATCPLVTRWVVYLSVPLCILSLFAKSLSMMFANCPFGTFGHFQLYRLLTHTFFDSSVFSVLFAAYTFNSVGKKVEGVRGTVFLLFSMLQLDIIIQLIFSLIATSLQMLVPSFHLYGSCSSGLWPIVFCLMVYEAQTDVVPTKQ
jgi:membrane associated rhomboid family serine protease